MNILAAGGVAEQAVPGGGCDALRTEGGEQACVDPEGPALARVGGAIFGVEIAEVVPRYSGKLASGNSMAIASIAPASTCGSQ